VTSKKVLFEKAEGIAKITLNIPETRNALVPDVRLELIDILQTTRDDNSVKVILLTGSGKAFCSGGDIRSLEHETAVSGRNRIKQGQRLIKAMHQLEKPIIAAINGAAVGAGVSLALASDILIASEKAKFFLSFVKVGVIPDWGGFYFLSLRVGVARAKELLFMGEAIDAGQAERIGLINKVVPPEKLEEETFSLARRLAHGPSLSYAMIKSALNQWPTSLETLLEMECNMQGVAFSSKDAHEGKKAFLEKREPVFLGE
jgi:2-(1,2-epoxy-1,2-dihydrophenyl)acetyl-CoA isomerase